MGLIRIFDTNNLRHQRKLKHPNSSGIHILKDFILVTFLIGFQTYSQ